MKNQKKVWNEIAESWSEYRNKPLDEVLSFLNDKKGKILDVGCGSGRHFIKKENIEFYGLDFSDKMLELVKKKSVEKKFSVVLKLIKNEKIPFEDNFFDLAICISVLHCIPKKERRLFLLKEIKRVLKPRSEFLLSVWSKNHKRIKNKGKEIFVPWKVGKKVYQRYYYIYNIEELKEEVENVGFKILEEKEDENVWLRLKNESV
ncbi:MAG: class I SAM-dependent methyltransferase [Candidatus Pacearchaeota archaeon]